MKTLAVALAALALGVAGCGSSDSGSSGGGGGSSDTGASGGTTTESTAPSGGGGGQQLTLAADKSALKFDKSSLQAKAGKVTITMDNPSSIPHAVAIEGSGIDKDGETVTQGGKSTVTADLKPGTYTFYCPVDGHRDAGMEGDLTVK